MYFAGTERLITKENGARFSPRKISATGKLPLWNIKNRAGWSRRRDKGGKTHGLLNRAFHVHGRFSSYLVLALPFSSHQVSPGSRPRTASALVFPRSWSNVSDTASSATTCVCDVHKNFLRMDVSDL